MGNRRSRSSGAVAISRCHPIFRKARYSTQWIASEYAVILPQSEASSKLRFRSRQVIEKMVTLTSSSWSQIARWLRQLDAVRSAA
jgi:hypothetical protein